MNAAWPLGRGNRLRSLAQFWTILAIAGLIIVIQLTREPSSDKAGLALTLAPRPWAIVLFAVLVMHAALLALFRPHVLRMLLPTPLTVRGLFLRIDPARRWLALILPLLAAVATALPRIHQIHDISFIAPIFLLSALFTMLVPALVYLAVLTRKFLVPWAPALSWMALAGYVWSTLRADGEGEGFAIYDGTFHATCLSVGIVCLLLIGRLRRSGRETSAKAISRDELLDLAYPTEPEPLAKPRYVLTERIGRTPRMRRVVHSFQMITNLHRASDWGKLLIECILAFTAIHLIGDYPANFVSTVLALMAVGIAAIMYLGLRTLHVDLEGLRASDLDSYALPKRWAERIVIQLALLSALYFAVGIASILLIWCLGPEMNGLAQAAARRAKGALPGMHPVTGGLTNLAQLWLLSVALLAPLPAMGRRRARGNSGGSRIMYYFWVCFGSVLALCTLLGFAIATTMTDTGWDSGLAHGLHRLALALERLVSVGVTDFGSAFVEDMLWIRPGTGFQALAWLLPLLLAAWAIYEFRRAMRARPDREKSKAERTPSLL